MKPVKEQTFREQIGTAAKNGAYSPSFQKWGFRALTRDGTPLTMTPEALEQWIDQFSERDVCEYVQLVLAKQPMDELFADWSRLDLLKLRAHLVLRLGDARGSSDEEKRLALARTYPIGQSLRAQVGGSPYRDDGPGRRLGRKERDGIYDDIAREVERRLVPLSAMDTMEATEGLRAIGDNDASDEDFLIEDAYHLYTYPSTTNDKLQISKSVTVRALRDGITEYRYTESTIERGRAVPEFGLLGGPAGAHLERLETKSRSGVPGFEYQVVIPFKTPMMKADQPRHFSWTIRSVVTDEFFEPSAYPRIVGFNPDRGLRSARIALQFASGMGPSTVAVNTDVRVEDAYGYDPTGETLPVVDDYVEKTWQDPRIARYCTLVWPR